MKTAAKIKGLLKEIAFPSDIKCIVCDCELPFNSPSGLCDNCRLEPNDCFCSLCGRPVLYGNTACDQCRSLTEPFEFTAARSCFNYKDNALKLVHKLKYGNARYLAQYMAKPMQEVLLSAGWQIDCVTCVPLHKSRLKQRGYNQSELLAKRLCELTSLPYSELVVKPYKTPDLVGLKAEERRNVVKNSFCLKDNVNIKGKTVLVIDDVLTTGSTSNECSRVLKNGGAEKVYVLTFASVEYKQLLI